jgi:hypothetical protein
MYFRLNHRGCIDFLHQTCPSGIHGRSDICRNIQRRNNTHRWHDQKLIPTVFSAVLMLTPVMASAMPVVNSGPAGASDITPKIPVSKPYQLSDAIAVPSVPPVTIAGQIMPFLLTCRRRYKWVRSYRR